ncbi:MULTISPECIES: YdcF family protein [Clostridia]|uniref:YdcF family protein n=1 Tax=Clostridia TaxID=186801 RepID=UPI000EA36213|nr:MULTISPECIES: YdcF family protein [Clostridia]NBJ70356.1 YdcF family protein [Roseburia sp. 1XD42-34]RKI76353.1 YdcF family protein [Clostridium sp. 1xD42-85]
MVIAAYILGVFILFPLAFIIVIHSLFRRASYNHGQQRDVLILLGYPAKKDGSLSPILRERINKAAQAYHQGICRTIICSGAAVYNDYNEAEIMAARLMDYGVPHSSILLEKQSQNTYQNLVHSRELMRQNNFTTAVIVSSPWHLRKASFYASKLGIEHTVEKSRIPKRHVFISIVIYFYIYTKMLFYHLRYQSQWKK